MLLVPVLIAGALVPALVRADPAPVLSVHGQTLSWTAVDGDDVYRLMIRAPSGQTVTTVVGRNVAPPALPGATVSYRVAASGRDEWSNEVSIVYAGVSGEVPAAGRETPAPGAGGGASGQAAGAPGKAGRAPGDEQPGHPKYRLDAASYFDAFGADAAPWIRSHVSLLKAYPPYGDKYLSLDVPVIGYHDPATEGQAPLGRAGIEAYVAKVRRDMNLGYRGVFVDDANWTFKPSPGPPAALADLLEAIRNAAPSAVIEMNSQYHDIWPLMKAHDANVERALRAVNIVTKEFGVGPSAAIETASDYRELFEFIDALHAKGIHVTMTGDRASKSGQTMEYNLATYLLANDGGDLINGTEQTPASWWPGFDVNLGTATSTTGTIGDGGVDAQVLGRSRLHGRAGGRHSDDQARQADAQRTTGDGRIGDAERRTRSGAQRLTTRISRPPPDRSQLEDALDRFDGDASEEDDRDDAERSDHQRRRRRAATSASR